MNQTKMAEWSLFDTNMMYFNLLYFLCFSNHTAKLMIDLGLPF